MNLRITEKKPYIFAKKKNKHKVKVKYFAYFKQFFDEIKSIQYPCVYNDNNENYKLNIIE